MMEVEILFIRIHFHAGTLTKQALDGIIGCKINLTPFAYEVDFRICRSKLVMDRVLEVPWQVEQKFSPLKLKTRKALFNLPGTHYPG